MRFNWKKKLALLTACALCLGMLTGCSSTVKSLGKKIGSKLESMLDLTDGAVEEDTTTWAAAGGSIELPEGMDTESHFTTQLVENTMYISFNGIQKRDTGYFSAPDGTLTFTAEATIDENSLKQFKVAVWQKTDGGTQYVEDSTYYIHTDGTCYTFTVSNLDPSASYRLTISYDRSSYYMYGAVKVEGVSELGAAPEATEDVA